MNKICTNIKQSQKLIELGIDVGTADMCWQNNEFPIGFNDNDDAVPAWSLVALLNVLEFPSLTQDKEDEWEVCVPNCESDEYIEVSAVNPIDACVKMIEKLHELKML